MVDTTHADDDTEVSSTKCHNRPSNVSKETHAPAAADDAEGGPTDRKPVEMMIKLALNFSAAGKAGSAQRAAFNNDLTKDLSNASGSAPHLFEVVRVSAGSIIVDTLIHQDPAGCGLHPMLVATDLQKQAHQPNSPLLSGLLTRHCEGIALPRVPPPPHPPSRLPTEIALLPATLQTQQLSDVWLVPDGGAARGEGRGPLLNLEPLSLNLDASNEEEGISPQAKILKSSIYS
jgi:hypothetical protein